MDIYLTVEEKYLQAVEEISYGENPRALQLLNEIVSADPLYARAHFQMGKLYYYEIKDYQAAGYHFKTCAELEPNFPDVYEHYLHLLVFLNMERQVQMVKDKALQVPRGKYFPTSITLPACTPRRKKSGTMRSALTRKLLWMLPANMIRISPRKVSGV